MPNPGCCLDTDPDNEGEDGPDGFRKANGLVSTANSVALGDRACCLRNAAAEIVRGPPGLAPFNDDVELAMRGDENGGVGRGYSGGGDRYMGDVGLSAVGEPGLPPPTTEVVRPGAGAGMRPDTLSLDTCPGCRSSVIGDAPLPRFANGGLGGRIGDGGRELCGVLPKEGCNEDGYGAVA